MKIPQVWRLLNSSYRLVGAMCRVCGHKAFPPSGVCPECRAQLRTLIPLEVVMPLSLRAERVPVPIQVTMDRPDKN